MREVVLRVPRRGVEDVLDRLLPIVPSGVREVPVGRNVELRMRGDDLPGPDELKAAARPWPSRVSEREISDDWRERRILDYEQELIGGRLAVRPEWAPEPLDADIEIVLGESPAFGAGTHPTTRACLELLLKLPVAGSFADLGCGTGVLAILAARLGWEPVTAVDVNPDSVEATRENARRNSVAIDAAAADLSTQPPPAADGLAANVPPQLHEAIASSLAEPVPQILLLSGFEPTAAPRVSSAYSARGLVEHQRIERLGWGIVVLKRD